MNTEKIRAYLEMIRAEGAGNDVIETGVAGIRRELDRHEAVAGYAQLLAAEVAEALKPRLDNFVRAVELGGRSKTVRRSGSTGRPMPSVPPGLAEEIRLCVVSNPHLPMPQLVNGIIADLKITAADLAAVMSLSPRLVSHVRHGRRSPLFLARFTELFGSEGEIR